MEESAPCEGAVDTTVRKVLCCASYFLLIW